MIAIKKKSTIDKSKTCKREISEDHKIPFRSSLKMDNIKLYIVYGYIHIWNKNYYKKINPKCRVMVIAGKEGKECLGIWYTQGGFRKP